MKKIIFSILFMLVLLLVIAISLILYWANAKGPLVQDTTISITKGATVRVVADSLLKNRVIDKPWLLEFIVRLKKTDRKLRAGEYYLPAGISIAEIVDKFERGDVFYRRITLTEGITTKMFLVRLSEEENLSGDITVDVKEGEMLAETYTFSKGDSRNSIIIQAKSALNKVLDTLWKQKKGTVLKDRYDALILASIIEKETAIVEEKGLVASVFLNRLRIGMRLQSDPTAIYALTGGRTWVDIKGFRSDHLKINSPYNTYIYGGLPPTPICNVGADSIEAALNPEDTKYIYFVANGKGGHHFANTYSEHKENIKKWIKVIRPKAN